MKSFSIFEVEALGSLAPVGTLTRITSVNYPELKGRLLDAVQAHFDVPREDIELNVPDLLSGRHIKYSTNAYIDGVPYPLVLIETWLF